MNRLGVITCSTRKGRKGRAVAEWFLTEAGTHSGFQIDDIDLAAVNLPLFDEPNHPRLRRYEHPHTRAWSERIAACDAFVFVSPEYNYGTPPSLANALDYLNSEWWYKPVSFVSYGGVSGGLRAVQMSKQIMLALKLVPIVEAVVVPTFMDFIDDEGQFRATDVHRKSAGIMLHELARWAEALKVLR